MSNESSRSSLSKARLGGFGVPTLVEVLDDAALVPLTPLMEGAASVEFDAIEETEAYANKSVNGM